MIDMICKNCGSNDITELNGERICNYCGTKYIITAEDKKVIESTIELNSDVAMHLEKCKREPERAKKYAQRILEIAPNSVEARRILVQEYNKSHQSTKNSSGCYIATAVYGSYDYLRFGLYEDLEIIH